MEKLFEQLNSPDKVQRLAAIRSLAESTPAPVKDHDVNSHIHTTYSFSPYSPSKAVWCGYTAGLRTVGIMDHDSVSGTREFLEAAKAVGIAPTIGMEIRVSMENTPLKGRKINNPDQPSIAYCTLHGIPHTQIDTMTEFIRPYTEKRIARDRKMLEKINGIVAPFGMELDFDRDVIPLSMYRDGGSITERHILFALSKKIVQTFGRNAKVVDFLRNDFGVKVSEKLEAYLTDADNPNYEYDLLGALKSDTSKFYIPATDECPDVKDVVALAKKTGAILAYAYLGDVTASVTGDKRAQKFEDDYLDELFEVISGLGFKAVTYMPSRNTKQQLFRVRSLCDRYNFFQISGEDINSPRQSFICMAQRDPGFANLYDAAWALIGHETEATKDLRNAFFSPETEERFPVMTDRIAHFRDIALKEFDQKD